MGFMDNFTSDSPVTVKQPDYYEMVKEAARILALDELKGTTLRDVWCVFDRDRHPSYREAFELASRNRRIRLC